MVENFPLNTVGVQKNLIFILSEITYVMTSIRVRGQDEMYKNLTRPA